MPYAQTLSTVREAIVGTFGTLDACFDLPADMRAYKPAADVWCIDEILEHITLTSHFLMLVIRTGCAKAVKRAQTLAIEAAESDLDRIRRIGDPDAFAWVRPEHMEPTRSKPMEAVRILMRQQQRECLALLGQMPNGEGSLHKVRMSVQDLGKLDMYEWLFFLAQHARRHNIEIMRLADTWTQSHQP